LKRSRIRSRRQDPAITAAQKEAMERDGYQCLLPTCGATDILDPAHVLPRRFRAERAHVHNLVCLCRKCHVAHETEAGRVRLLVLLDELYEYGPFYERPPYQRYWRQRDE